MKYYVFLFLAFLLWSTSSSIIVNFKGILPPIQSASIVLFISFTVASFYFLVKSPDVIRIIFKCKALDVIKTGLAGALGLFAYPIFYFCGLHSNSPVEANVINYFWPMMGVFAGFVMGVESFTWKKLGAILLGFTGVFITTVSIKRIGAQEAFHYEGNLSAYLYAFLGALAYGLYTAFIKRISLKTTNGDIVPIQSRFLIFLTFSASFHLLLNLHSGFAYFHFVEFTTDKLLFILFYSVFNFTIAYFAWAYGVSKVSISNASLLAYLIPVASTFVLAYWNSMHVEQNSIYGLTFILVGLYVHQDNKVFITPLMGLSFCFVIFGALSVILPVNLPEYKDNLLDILGLLIAIFAIYSGFVLSRVVTLYYNENALFLLIEHKIVALYKASHESCPEIQNEIDNYMNFLIEQNSSFKPFSIRDQLNFDLQNSNLLANIKALLPKTENASNQMDEIEQHVSNWRYSKGEKLSVYEWIILILLVMIPIFIIYQLRNNIPLFDVVSIVFSTALMLYFLVIIDFDLRRPREKIEFILLTQRLSNLLKLPPFVPTNYTKSFFFTKKLAFNNEKHTTIRTFEDGSYKNIKVNFVHDTFFIASIFSISITMALLAYSMYSKYVLPH